MGKRKQAQHVKISFTCTATSLSYVLQQITIFTINHLNYFSVLEL